MKINHIGDSHISVFTGIRRICEAGIWENYPIDKRILHVGARTAYNLIEKEDILKLCNDIPKDEGLVLSFGEIDCRCRVGRSDTPMNNLSEVVNRYGEFINKIENKNIFILGVTPCLVEKPMKDWFEEDKTREEIFTATRGSIEDRNMWKHYFNNSMKIYCKERGCIFIDTWGEVYGKKEFYMDDVHLDGSVIKLNYL